MTHSASCQKRQQQVEVKAMLYESDWPRYCRTCKGYGKFDFTENGAPHGEGFWAMPMSEPCEDCTDLGVCPRCGQDGLTSEDRGDKDTGSGPCKFCGWDYGDAGLPEYECWGECVDASAEGHS